MNDRLKNEALKKVAEWIDKKLENVDPAIDLHNREMIAATAVSRYEAFMDGQSAGEEQLGTNPYLSDEDLRCKFQERWQWDRGYAIGQFFSIMD